jgi:RNA polymerase sigma-70 factor (ECF subfamily)
MLSVADAEDIVQEAFVRWLATDRAAVREPGAYVVVQSDGGGKRAAALQPIAGIEAVMQLHQGLAALFAQQRSQLIKVGFINGLPGFVSLEGDGVLQTTALELADGKISAVYVVRNPDKLRHLEGALES